MSDKRRFFIALDKAELKWEYITNPTATAMTENDFSINPLKHSYEIIRENCPCKLYMDVEVDIIIMIHSSLIMLRILMSKELKFLRIFYLSLVIAYFINLARKYILLIIPVYFVKIQRNLVVM